MVVVGCVVVVVCVAVVVGASVVLLSLVNAGVDCSRPPRITKARADNSCC